MSLPIRTEEDYNEALERLRELFDAKPNTEKGIEFESLMDIIENYENEHYNLDKDILDFFRDQL